MNIKEAKSSTSPLGLIYGLNGRGKSTLAFKSEKPVAILTEPGVPGGMSVPAFEGINRNEDVLKAIGDLIHDEHDYGSLVVDTLDNYEQMLLDYTCRMNNWKTIEQPAYGKGYVAADDEWRRFIRGITALRNKRGMAVLRLSRRDHHRTRSQGSVLLVLYAQASPAGA